MSCLVTCMIGLSEYPDIGYAFELNFMCIQCLGSDPSLDWPSRGEIKLDRISVRYADTLPAVIKDVSLYVRPGEKVGIPFCITFVT